MFDINYVVIDRMIKKSSAKSAKIRNKKNEKL